MSITFGEKNLQNLGQEIYGTSDKKYTAPMVPLSSWTSQEEASVCGKMFHVCDGRYEMVEMRIQEGTTRQIEFLEIRRYRFCRAESAYVEAMEAIKTCV